MVLSEQCAPQSSSFAEKGAFYASAVREAREKHGASLLVSVAAAQGYLMLFVISQEEKDQWKHLVHIKFSSLEVGIGKLTGRESCKRGN